MEVESILDRVFEVARSNGGYLTIGEAARSCDKQLERLADGETATGTRRNENNNNNNNSNNSNNNKKAKRNDSCSSDSSGSSSCGSSGSSSRGGFGSGSSNSNTKNNDRAEANERRLKDIIRASGRFKLNGNVLFVNSGAPSTKPRVTSSRLTDLRSDSLPELLSDLELVSKIRRILESREEKSDSIANLMCGLANVKSSAARTVGDFKRLMAEYPAHFAVHGDDVRLVEGSPGRSSNGSPPGSDRSVDLGSAASSLVLMMAAMSRSHSLDRCDVVTSDGQPRAPKPPLSNRATASVASSGSFSGWPDLECISRKYKNSERLVAVVKNFESDVQLAADRLIKQMRSELDSMLVELHRPASKNVGEGRVFCLEKKWGIVDLGNHDHVFFDMSIMLGNVDDLRSHFRIGETLGFEAVRAQKSSRANWRAIRVWKVDRSEDHHHHHHEDASLAGSPPPEERTHASRDHEAKAKFHQESGSSKGNSPDASPGGSRWRKKPSNPLSRGDPNPSHERPQGFAPFNVAQKLISDSQPKSGRTGSTGAMGHSPLITRSSFPLQSKEVRLLPYKILTPPENKKNINSSNNNNSSSRNSNNYNNNSGSVSTPVFFSKAPARTHKTSEPAHKISTPLQIVSTSLALRDSGTESGNSSPDALLRAEKILETNYEEYPPHHHHHLQQKHKILTSVCCQTE